MSTLTDLEFYKGFYDVFGSWGNLAVRLHQEAMTDQTYKFWEVYISGLNGLAKLREQMTHRLSGARIILTRSLPPTLHGMIETDMRRAQSFVDSVINLRVRDPKESQQTVERLTTEWNEVVTSLHAWIAHISAQEKVEQNECESGRGVPNGFTGNGQFFYGGKEIVFGRAALQLRLVKTLWDNQTRAPKEPSAIEDVMREVWGHDHMTTDGAYRQLCTDVNNRFLSQNAPIRITNERSTARIKLMS